MARTPLTPAQRTHNVAFAAAALPKLIDAAGKVAAQHGADSAEARKAWAHVEAQGAIVHRQSRLLAGKSRGG